MMYFKKFFKIPGPKALGMSDNDCAMASELFRNNSTETTWEMYYDRVKKDYPVKYFLSCTVPEFFRDRYMAIKRPISDSVWFLKYHLIPEYRYHWVDLRQPKSAQKSSPYRYGWMDTDWRIVYAIKNLFVEFVEKEMPGSCFIPSEEEAAKDDGVDYQYAGFKIQRENYLEVMKIYKYWKEDQLFLDKNYDDALIAWVDKRKENRGDDSPELTALHSKMIEAEKIRDDALDDMLHRSIKIRKCLWT